MFDFLLEEKIYQIYLFVRKFFVYVNYIPYFNNSAYGDEMKIFKEYMADFCHENKMSFSEFERIFSKNALLSSPHESFNDFIRAKDSLEIISRNFEIENQKVLEVGCGEVPILGNLLAKRQYDLGKGTLTLFDNRLIHGNCLFPNMQGHKRMLTPKTDVSSFDTIIGSHVCESTGLIIEKACMNKKNFMVFLCNCPVHLVNKENQSIMGFAKFISIFLKKSPKLKNDFAQIMDVDSSTFEILDELLKTYQPDAEGIAFEEKYNLYYDLAKKLVAKYDNGELGYEELTVKRYDDGSLVDELIIDSDGSAYFRGHLEYSPRLTTIPVIYNKH